MVKISSAKPPIAGKNAVPPIARYILPLEKDAIMKRGPLISMHTESCVSEPVEKKTTIYSPTFELRKKYVLDNAHDKTEERILTLTKIESVNLGLEITKDRAPVFFIRNEKNTNEFKVPYGLFIELRPDLVSRLIDLNLPEIHLYSIFRTGEFNQVLKPLAVQLLQKIKYPILNTRVFMQKASMVFNVSQIDRVEIID
ncbi:MAG: hypothetical protein QW171_02350 [Candidatus Bilamarchaeaceae archaeon]